MKIPETEINIIQKGQGQKLSLFTGVHVNHHIKKFCSEVCRRKVISRSGQTDFTESTNIQ